MWNSNFQADFLDYELLISIETDHLWVYHGKMVSLIIIMVRWWILFFNFF